MSDNTNDTSYDILAELAQLREQIKALISERMAPSLSRATETAQQYTSEAHRRYWEQAEALSEQVRQSPGPAILVAAAVGYIFGRLVR